MKLLLALKDYSSAISETGYILKEDDSDLEALLLRGRAYYYLADHEIAMRFVFSKLGRFDACFPSRHEDFDFSICLLTRKIILVLHTMGRLVFGENNGGRQCFCRG